MVTVKLLYDANGDGTVDAADGANALECDLVAGITRLRLRALLGPTYNPEFVRPPYWEYNSAVLNAYASTAVRQALGNSTGLKMILTDI
jgi:hypothetical protein